MVTDEREWVIGFTSGGAPVVMSGPEEGVRRVRKEDVPDVVVVPRSRTEDAEQRVRELERKAIVVGSRHGMTQLSPEQVVVSLGEALDLEMRERERAEAKLATAIEALRDRAESCREELGAEANFRRCGKPAEFILWGKLIEPEALGPRCYDCAARHVGHQALAPSSGYAIFDLRPIAGALAEIQGEERSDG